MEDDLNEILVRAEDTEPLPLDANVLDDLLIQQTQQTIRHRDLLVRVILSLYGFTLIATLALFYLAGFDVIELADNVLISLSGVLVGELGVGAVLMVIVKSIFPNA